MSKVRVSYRLEEDADKIIRKLSQSWGVSQAKVIEVLARASKDKELRVVNRDELPALWWAHRHCVFETYE